MIYMYITYCFKWKGSDLKKSFPIQYNLVTIQANYNNCNELLAVQSVTVQAVNTVQGVETKLVMPPPQTLEPSTFAPAWYM